MNTLFFSGLGFQSSILPVKCDEHTLIGWSLGGLYAIHLAKILKNRVHKLVLLASTPAFLAKKDWPGIAEAQMLALQEMLEKTPAQFDRHFLSLVQFPNRDRAFKSTLHTHYRTPSIASLQFLIQTDLRETFAQLRLPINVYLGEKDAILPSNDLITAYKKLNQNVEITLIRNASHAFFLEEKFLNEYAT